MIRFVNEYRYSIEDTRQVLKGYYSFFPRTQITHYATLVIGAFSLYLYFQTSLVRFIVFAVILFLLFLYRFLQMGVGARYDAAKIKEDTGMDNPMIRYELDSELRVYREGSLHATLNFEDMIGAKEIKDALVIFTNKNYTAMFKNAFYLEGGNTALKAYLREKGIVVK